MVRVRNLTKRFGGKTVLSGLNADLPDRGVVAVIGPSGSGKTTFLNILLGLEKPDSGEIAGLEGRVFTCVFQEDRLFENMSVRKNLRLVLDRGTPDSAIAAHLGRVGLASEMDSRVKTLSGGMKRRVALCRAVLAKGNVLTLDEPFKGLDEEAKRTACGYIKEFASDRLILLVTHDMNEARLLGAAQTVAIPGRESE